MNHGIGPRPARNMETNKQITTTGNHPKAFMSTPATQSSVFWRNMTVLIWLVEFQIIFSYNLSCFNYFSQFLKETFHQTKLEVNRTLFFIILLQTYKKSNKRVQQH